MHNVCIHPYAFCSYSRTARNPPLSVKRILGGSSECLDIDGENDAAPDLCVPFKALCQKALDYRATLDVSTLLAYMYNDVFEPVGFTFNVIYFFSIKFWEYKRVQIQLGTDTNVNADAISEKKDTKSFHVIHLLQATHLPAPRDATKSMILKCVEDKEEGKKMVKLGRLRENSFF